MARLGILDDQYLGAAAGDLITVWPEFTELFAESGHTVQVLKTRAFAQVLKMTHSLQSSESSVKSYQGRAMAFQCLAHRPMSEVPLTMWSSSLPWRSPLLPPSGESGSHVNWQRRLLSSPCPLPHPLRPRAREVIGADPPNHHNILCRRPSIWVGC